MAAGLFGLVYGICAGVILAAYHEFASQSLLDQSPLVAADPTPLKLPPEERTQEDTAVSRGLAARGSRAAALADAAPLAPSVGETLLGETLPAPGGSDAGQDRQLDPPPAIERPAIARHETAPDVEVDILASTAPDLEVDILASNEWSVAAAPETPLEAGPAASLESAALASSDDVLRSGPTATSGPVPAFKPLDVIPTVVAEAAPAALGAAEAPRRGVSRIRPPRPSLKPVVMPSEARPEPAREQDARTVAAAGQTLPEALRAFWTNLKILLASAPASSDLRAGGDGSSGAGGNTGGGTGGSGSGGSTSSTGGSGGGSSASGGGSSASGNGSSASSGGDGSSASTGGNSGRGRGDGARGGRGGRGDGDRGGRGGGRGGDDDDDDDGDDDD